MVVVFTLMVLLARVSHANHLVCSKHTAVFSVHLYLWVNTVTEHTKVFNMALNVNVEP